MSDSEIFSKIAEMIEDVADISRDEIEMNSAFIDDLDLASLEVIAIMSKIEQEYSINIKEEELLQIATVSDLIEHIKSKQA